MDTKLTAMAVGAMVVGFLLVTLVQTGLVGGLLVTGGAYALVLPAFIEPQRPAGQ